MTQKEKSVNTTYLGRIKKMLAVSSAKGGVGKSTVAADLARALRDDGKKVGLLDADLYGPSVPILFQCESTQAVSKNKILQPVMKENIVLMSFGFILGDQSAILRGPMVTRYIQHMLTQTAWPELDYLIIDFPPGTGDIALTIMQTVTLNGAFIVTTPHPLALTDVERGVQMFRRMRVPILGIVENMAYMQVGESRHYLFGELNKQKIETDLDAAFVAHIPVDPTFSTPMYQEAFQKILQEINTCH